MQKCYETYYKWSARSYLIISWCYDCWKFSRYSRFEDFLFESVWFWFESPKSGWPKKWQKNPKCVEGWVVGWEHWLRNNVYLGLPVNCLCFIMFLFWSSHVYLLAENLARKSRSKMTSLGPTARVKCEALQAWDESGSGRLTVAGVASVCRLSLWWQSSDATKRTNQSSQKGRRMVLAWSEESSYTLLVQESSYVPLQRFRW